MRDVSLNGKMDDKFKILFMGRWDIKKNKGEFKLSFMTVIR